jgi:hypothetical protein
VSDTSTSGTPPDRTTAEQPVEFPPDRTGWIGWIIFAALMLILAGIFELVAGFVAIVDEDYFQATGAAPLFLAVDQQTWGVLQLIFGSIAILTGAGLLYGNIIARAFGVGIALIGALTSLLAIGVYPVWSVIMIAFDVVVIYAIAQHGEEMRPAG